MFEELLAFALLLDVGIASLSEYHEYLDEHFLKTPDNDLLMELEWHSSDMRESISIIRNYCYGDGIDYDVFGRFLFSKLEEIYRQTRMSIQDFGKKSYAIWQQFPETIQQVEPFWTLCYADDPLSWCDEKQSRELYEKAFRFFK